ncbi:MAG: hypothetical protein NTV16_10825 [Actinobacteria bacterium]|nr:hypothetical protein [Actinomycetota bacterium]
MVLSVADTFDDYSRDDYIDTDYTDFLDLIKFLLYRFTQKQVKCL